MIQNRHMNAWSFLWMAESRFIWNHSYRWLIELYANIVVQCYLDCFLPSSKYSSSKIRTISINLEKMIKTIWIHYCDDAYDLFLSIIVVPFIDCNSLPLKVSFEIVAIHNIFRNVGLSTRDNRFLIECHSCQMFSIQPMSARYSFWNYALVCLGTQK